MEQAFESRNLDVLAQHLLEQARTAASGRSAMTVYGGREHHLRQTLIAIRSGERLPEHPSPGEATLQVLHGSCVLGTVTKRARLTAGDYAHIPNEVHALDASDDVVVLLTTVVGAHRE